MYCRSVSSIIHGSTSFYAHNISIIPLYNKIFPSSIAHFVPKGYAGDTIPIDPDLPIYRRNWVEHQAKVFKSAFEVVNWVHMNGGQAPLSFKEWMQLDEFMREAIKLASNEVTKEIEDRNKQLRTDLENKIENQKQYKSPFEGAPKPSFIE